MARILDKVSYFFKKIKNKRRLKKLEKSEKENQDLLQDLKEEVRELEKGTKNKIKRRKRESGNVQDILKREIERDVRNIKKKKNRQKYIFTNLERIDTLSEKIKRGIISETGEGLTESEIDNVIDYLSEIHYRLEGKDMAVESLKEEKYESLLDKITEEKTTTETDEIKEEVIEEELNVEGEEFSPEIQNELEKLEE